GPFPRPCSAHRIRGTAAIRRRIARRAARRTYIESSRCGPGSCGSRGYPQRVEVCFLCRVPAVAEVQGLALFLFYTLNAQLILVVVLPAAGLEAADAAISEHVAAVALEHG